MNKYKKVNRNSPVRKARTLTNRDRLRIFLAAAAIAILCWLLVASFALAAPRIPNGRATPAPDRSHCTNRIHPEPGCRDTQVLPTPSPRQYQRPVPDVDIPNSAPFDPRRPHPHG